LSETYFAPLRGTAQEASAIKTLFPDTKMLTGRDANETSVKELNAPRTLHLATHGFFLENSTADKPDKTKIENPLLRSGLAFAGANRRSGDKDDGILTALEASGLNLWGTKLVVLSACDTGLGEIHNGEGVYGLRRSFVLAGAESVVMSMWPVSDFVTRELMTNYYKNLKKGMGRGEALRQVQLEMIKRPNRQHPFYWASFIQSGEWANLDGHR
jgi:CHAT domain-containing protein